MKRLCKLISDYMAVIPGAIFSVWRNISGAIVARLYRMDFPSHTN